MNIRALSHFVQVADCKSYSLAAKKNFISQSTLSTTIKKLEDELSIRLFNYDGKILHLTEEGQRFYDLSSDLLAAYDNFSVSAKQISEEVFGEINIILPPLIADIFFAKPIAEFQRKYPSVRINVANRGGFIAQNLVSVNEYDLAVTIRPVIPNAFECVDITSEPMVLAVHKTHPLANEPEVNYADLASEKFLSYEEDSVLYQRFMAKTSEAGYIPNIITRAAETPFLLTLVERNNGVLVVPKCVVNYRTFKNISFVKIVGEEQGYRLVMIRKKDKSLSTAAQMFVQFICEWYATDLCPDDSEKEDENSKANDTN